MAIDKRVSASDLQYYRLVLKDVCAKFNWDYVIAQAQIEQESGYYPKAVSSCEAKGIAQFMDSTWKWVYPATCAAVPYLTFKNDPYDPFTALWCYGYLMGVGIPAELKNLKQPDNVVNRLVAYNAGPGRVKNEAWRKIKETSQYVSIILKKNGR